ncbi:hypothetical protein Salat_0516200 [Sesamum alatum]|uniref:Uncharacterized protein n=1 Tax=Sesamum alatum TaxID=300844 RepID=A0AAE2D0Z3_9LAMI|nr:hypothetical protein Salat_0516200 [Sesamum alatum]
MIVFDKCYLAASFHLCYRRGRLGGRDVVNVMWSPPPESGLSITFLGVVFPGREGVGVGVVRGTCVDWRACFYSHTSDYAHAEAIAARVAVEVRGMNVDSILRLVDQVIAARG